jgi:hypothetical protein
MLGHRWAILVTARLDSPRRVSRPLGDCPE